MNPELAYFLKINIGIIVFYAFYRLFFYKDTFFHWRRFVLLSFLFVSLVYPLFNIQEWVKSHEPMVVIADIYATYIIPEFTITPEVTSFSWKTILFSSAWYIYLTITLLLLLRFFIQLISILRLKFTCKTQQLMGCKIYVLPKLYGPFSFFKSIFIHPESHTGLEIEEILTHELTHVKQWHSIDVILSELFCVICWLNPFVWLLKREIRSNLEYLADSKVIENGHDHRAYQYHLLGLAHHKPVATLSNNFNVLPLKNRIKMMNKKRTKEIGRTKYIMFIPLAAILLVISNIETIANNIGTITENIEDSLAPILNDEEPIKITDAMSVLKIEDVDQEPEKMPEFPGGTEALMKFLSDNMKYPESAKDRKVQGRVIIQFVVENDGTINNPVVTRGVDEDLDEEAIRVVKLMPKWTPGEINGKKVPVKYTIPIAFRLSNGVTVEGTQAVMPVESNKTNEEAVVNTEHTFTSTWTQNEPLKTAEKKPEFPGGVDGLVEFLQRNIKYPPSAVEKKVQGRVIVQFIVGKDGTISNSEIARSIDESLDEEALRVINLMPKWRPGENNGEQVAVRYTVPVNFRLPPDENKLDANE